jgi:hypothetical protein
VLAACTIYPKTDCMQPRTDRDDHRTAWIADANLSFLEHGNECVGGFCRKPGWLTRGLLDPILTSSLPSLYVAC